MIEEMTYQINIFWLCGIVTWCTLGGWLARDIKGDLPNASPMKLVVVSILTVLFWPIAWPTIKALAQYGVL